MFGVAAVRAAVIAEAAETARRARDADAQLRWEYVCLTSQRPYAEPCAYCGTLHNDPRCISCGAPRKAT